MKSPFTFLLIPFLLLAALVSAAAQQSDYQIKENFEKQFRALRDSIDSSLTLEELDTLTTAINGFEVKYAPHSAFLDKALYPETFRGKMAALRTSFMIAHDRLSVISAQTGKITEMETKMTALETTLDSLNKERNELFTKLRSAQQSLSAVRQTMNRLQNTLQARDQLIFSMVDSIFLPYDQSISQLSEGQKERISTELAQTSVVDRIAAIAADNMRFIDLTQLQPKDYANLIDHYQQFRRRWEGLRGEVDAVVISGTKTGKDEKVQASVDKVDTQLAEWRDKLQASAWAALENEFQSHQVPVHHFTDAQSFSESIRAYVDSMNAAGSDASTFVEDVWIPRVDKEWRDVLTKETMLGRDEYTALDQKVSELHQERFNWMIVVYILIVIALIYLGWRLMSRKSRPRPERTPEGPAPTS